MSKISSKLPVIKKFFHWLKYLLRFIVRVLPSFQIVDIVKNLYAKELYSFFFFLAYFALITVK